MASEKRSRRVWEERRRTAKETEMDVGAVAREVLEQARSADWTSRKADLSSREVLVREWVEV